MARDRTADITLSELENWAGMLSHVVHQIGDAAEEAVAEAVRLAEEKSTDPAAHKFRSAVYATLGNYHKQTGNQQRALDAYDDAIAEANTAGDERAAARWLNNKRQIYMLLAQWDEANTISEQTRQIYERLKDYQGAANQLMDEGHLALSNSKPIFAADYWSYAFVLFHQIRQSSSMLFAALFLNRAYKMMGDRRGAEACLRYCFAKAEAESTARPKCYALGELATLQADQAETLQAINNYTEAISLAQELGDVVEQDFRIGRGRLFEKLGQAENAAEDYRRVIMLQEAMRGGFRAAERRVQAQSRSEEAYMLLARLLARKPDNHRAVSEAFTVAERARSHTLAELLSRRRIRQPASLPPELARREQALLAQLSRLEESEESGLEASRQYAQLSEELDAVWQEIAEVDEACRDYIDLRSAPIVGLGEIARLLAV
jgi:tetratricopeptide (TPR) repeat protein